MVDVMKSYMNTHLHQKGVPIPVVKRPQPNVCEVCGLPSTDSKSHLGYHHWDRTPIISNQFVLGIWLCKGCHCNAETVDKYLKSGRESKDFKYIREFISVYMVMKDKICNNRE